GMDLDEEYSGDSSVGGSGDEISIGEDDDEDMDDAQEADEKPKRQRIS
ncbi:hypothetical protein ABEF95_000031, partial [Exophiala dermatitidis]